MFDVSGGELLVVGIVALIVIGPKELPGLLRTVGQASGKLRKMAGEFRQQFDDAMREAELSEAQKKMEETADLAKSAMTAFNPIETIRNELRSTVDEIKGAGQQAEAAINAGSAAPAVAPAVEAAPAPAAPPAAAAASDEPPIEVLQPSPPAVKPGAAA
jgi:sec-independent protein translocase protein TatB